MELAQSGLTYEPLVGEVLTARQINTTLGGAFVAPWELAHLPETVIDQLTCLDSLSAWRVHYDQVEQARQRWLDKHEAVH